MKSKKIYPILFILFLLLALAGLTKIVPFTNKGINQETFGSNYKLNTIKPIIQINDKDFKANLMKIPVFGYQLKLETSPNIERDNNGQLSVYIKDLGTVRVQIRSQFGDFNFKNLKVDGKVFVDKNSDTAFSYDISCPVRGFFMDFEITSDLIYVNLAFDNGDSQVCLEGLQSSGYEVINPLFTHTLLCYSLNQEGFMRSEFIHKTYGELVQNLKSNQLESLKIVKNTEPKSILSPRPQITVTNYGIAHEKQDFSSVNLAERLASDYWIPYTEIDYGIYRRNPSESQIKSDLQYYNKDHIDGFTGYIRNIKAYAIYAHGSPYPAWESHWIMWYFIFDIPGGTITPSEIQNLWYTSYPSPEEYIDVHPNDMLLLATVCYGYALDFTRTPYMAKAFVDNGALAFVGATVMVPVEQNDGFTHTFWYDLCHLDAHVKMSTEGYIISHNFRLGGSWEYGDEIKVYGNEYGYLNN